MLDMIKCSTGGAYYARGEWVPADGEASAALAAKGFDAAAIENAKTGTMAYSILQAHNTSGDAENLKIKFDAMASHDITFVGIIQTARASGLEKFPIPYVLTNCHNSLCAVGGTINEDDHRFGLSAAKKYGGIFVPPHLAVIHQYMREKFAARWAEGVERAYRILADYPRTVTGNFWHKDIYPDQVWLDGLYMGMPFYAACLTENGEDNWDDILDQFTSAHKLLWDEQLGLYRHANDCSRKMEWADPVTGQSPVVWLRAEGWFLMALADTYEIAKDRTPRAGELCPLLKNALDRLLPYQVADTGMFLQVVDRADLTGNYSETSGSAMVAYALMKGARLGMLPPEYGEKGSRVLDGIRDTYLKKGEQGWELHGICASAGLGPGPDNRTDRTGTPEYYLSEKQMVDNQHGAAACMMAVSEQLRRA